MALAEKHVFQVLTKRPDRMLAYLTSKNREDIIGEKAMPSVSKNDFGLLEWPIANVWMGVSVEDQQTADERIPLLLQTPAVVRWVSAEPLLGPIDLEAVPVGMFGPLRPHGGSGSDTPRLDWVVVGSEFPVRRPDPCTLIGWTILKANAEKRESPCFSSNGANGCRSIR